MRRVRSRYFFIVIIMNSVICLTALSLKVLYASSELKEEVIINLKNGDRIRGILVLEDEKQITIENEIIGRVSIKTEFIDKVVAEEETKIHETKEAKPKLWQREISLGYNRLSGNTNNSQASMGLYANRKTGENEFTIKGDVLYSSSDKKMDTQKWYSMIRYAFSFWNKKWYNFYKLESDHDRFANIDYRMIPSSGIGYWLYDTPDLKAMVEIAMGLEHTDYRDQTKDTNEAVLIPKAYWEKRFFKESRISQDIIFYQPLSDTGEYRLHSETAFINPINDKFSLRFSFIDDYNSHPARDTKKNDTRFISSLNYSF